MRKTTFVGLAIVIASCTSIEKTSEKPDVTTVPISTLHDNPVRIEALHDVLREHGLVQSPLQQVKISLISDRIIDVSVPDAPKYLAALVEDRQAEGTIIAMFDPTKNMALVAYTLQEFPDVISYVDELGYERMSGQGPELTAHALRLADTGDVVAITAKSEKQYVQGTEDNEDVWLFALWKNEVVMLMGYPRNFTHLISNNNGYARTRRLDSEFIVTDNKTRGLYDVVLRTVSVAGDDPGETSEVAHIFNGVEYIKK